MAVSALIIGAAVLGTIGIGKGTKACFDQGKANKVSSNSEERLESSAKRLNETRVQCSDALSALGLEKIYVLNDSIKLFLELFTKLKNVDFTDSVGLDELNNLHIDKKDFEEFAQMSNFASSIVNAVSVGAAGGAAAAIGAYGLVGKFALASTGKAISGLSGVAAKNATLAWFGGGSLASGGAGVAGGTAVLGGVLAGVALYAFGTFLGYKAGTNLESAKVDAENISVVCDEYETSTDVCVAIRRRSYMFYGLLTRLEAYVKPLLSNMQKIIDSEGIDYSLFSSDSKKIIAAVVSAALTIKSVLDTPILNDDGSLTEESGNFLLENKGI